MPFEPGTKLGPYEIVAPIGAGNDVEVYQANDSEAGRVVAIQLIPPEWTSSSGFSSRKEQFERAAQAVSAQENSAARKLHEIREQDGVAFLVLEHLEGQTLAEKIGGKPLPVHEALSIAISLAEALDNAHLAGGVHRELTPANVMLTKSGIKLLDFGWSDLRPGAGDVVASRSAAAGAAAKPKLDEGPALNYTSPEQLEGKPADPRCDIFALGAIFYEMLTGRKAFDGRSRAVLIAAITTAEPEPLAQVAPRVPRILDHAIQRCLEKNPDDRWQTAHDLLLRLRWVAEGGKSGGIAAPDGRKRLWVLAAAGLLIAALAYPAARYFRGGGPIEALQFRIPVAGLSTADIALSPDGQTLALVIRPNTQEPAALYLRRMNSLAFLRLGGTEDASQPFWSPDSRYVGFVGAGRLKSVATAGGAPKDICEAPSFSGGAWNQDGTIVFGSAKGIFRVSAEGGRATPVTTAAEPETGHSWPSLLPDGKHFLFLVWSTQPASRGVYIASLDGKEKTKLMAAESNALYTAPGYVLFHRDASLFAQPFSPSKRVFTGEPIHVADDVASSSANGRGHFSVSQAGGLVYFQGARSSEGRGRTVTTQLGWVDRHGARRVTAGDGGNYGDMDLSPDGKLIAVTQQEAAGADIWVVDWQRGASTRLTLDPADDVDPVWSPDGTRLAFTTYRKGNADIYVKNANNVGAESPLLATPNPEIVKDWSKDGHYLAFLTGADNLMDIWAFPLPRNGQATEEKPFPLVQGKFQKSEPQFSYDVKWLAYTSDETGTFQVTVQSFPAGDQKLQVSTAGGGQPRWRKDGKELYFRSLDGAVMAVDIKTSPKLEAGIPHLLFRSPSVFTIALDPVRHQLAVTPDGERFLLRFGNAASGGGVSSNVGAGVPEAQPFASQSSVRGVSTIGAGAGGGAITTGLTVMQHWPAAIEKGEK